MSALHYALLGSHPELSELELTALLQQPVERLSGRLVRFSLPERLTASELQNLLGGTVKIAQEIATIPLSDSTGAKKTSKKSLAVTIDDIPDSNALTQEQQDAAEPIDISALLSEQLERIAHEQADNESKHTKKIQFGLTILSQSLTANPTRVKKTIQAAGVAARFREGSQPYGISAAVLLNHAITELIVLTDNDTIVIAQTVACQDIDVWTWHDRERPFADRKRGMLPLKVARMLVTIATQGDYANHHVYDPFCGAGSILQEAMELGSSVVGSDISQEAVAGTQTNLEWYAQSVLADTKRLQETQLFVTDVAHVKLRSFKKQPTVIVTEPFLGKQQASLDALPNVYKGLYKLYKGALLHWLELLPAAGTVVMIFPSVTVTMKSNHTRVFHLQKLIDELPDLGYTIVSGPVEYARPDAHTRRNVYVLQKKSD